MSERSGKVAAIMRANRQRVKGDRRVQFLLLGLPVLIMVLVGTIFGTGGKRVPVGVISTGSGALGTDLVARLREQPDISVRRYHHQSHLRSDIRRTRLLAGVIIPAGYDAALRAGRPVQVHVVMQPGRTDTANARVDISEAVATQAAIVTAARVARDQTGVSLATGLKRAADLVARFDKRAGRVKEHRSAFSYTAPSNLVLFLFITSISFGSGFVATRRYGVLRRMLATPTRPVTIMLGFAGSAFGVAVAQIVGLLAVGYLLFGVRWGDPLALGLLVLLLAVAGAAANLVTGTIANTPEQAISVGVPVGIALGMLGGTMWPLEGVGPAMRAVGHIFPHAWAMDAFVALIFHHGRLGTIGPDLLAIGLWAVGLAVLATIRLRRVVVRIG
ncbi:MAG TPA: ABC transporter permease [Acidimicrobiales bacterium]|nr:ABC transporter permease [Acidimicrobiales bacterium]